MSITIIRLSEFWSALHDASAQDLSDLADHYREHEDEIAELYDRHYLSLRWSDHAPHSADATWDAVFSLAYRPYLNSAQVWRGLFVFNRTFESNVRSIPNVLSVLADADDDDYVRLSRNWVHINDGSFAYRNLVNNFRFPWERPSLPKSTLDNVSSAINALLVACVSALTVERRDKELVVDPILRLMSAQLAKAS